MVAPSGLSQVATNECVVPLFPVLLLEQLLLRLLLLHLLHLLTRNAGEYKGVQGECRGIRTESEGSAIECEGNAKRRVVSIVS